MPRVPKFKSKFERAVWEEAIEIDDKIRYEPKGLKLPYILEGNYTPDFVLSNGIIVETKGAFPYEQRRKMAAVRVAHPDLDIRFVFQRAENKLGRGSKMNYGEWAEKNGFPWANGRIPDDWLKEKKRNDGRTS